jgi:hypothetical protein
MKLAPERREVAPLGLRAQGPNSEDRISADPISGDPIFEDQNSGGRILACPGEPNVAARRPLVSCYTKVRRSWFKLQKSLLPKRALVLLLT